LSYEVERYINRSSFRKKTKVLDEQIIKSLEEVVLYFGKDIFNRNKSIFSQQIIENTIPTMINYGIMDIKEHLIKLQTVKKNSLEHYQLIYGTVAENIYKEKTKKSIQNKDNFIKRHGNKKGIQLWNEYYEKKQKQNTLDFFKERFGDTIGNIKFQQYIERQRYTNTIDYYVEKHGKQLGRELYYQRYPAYEYSNDYIKYKNAVYRASQKTYEQNKNIINPNNYTRTKMGIENGWQLDHIMPIIECFKNNLTIEEAADIKNLRMLPWKENLMRNFKNV